MWIQRFSTGLLLYGCLLANSPAAAVHSSDAVSLIFVGDVMVAHDEETGKLIEQGSDPFQPCASLLAHADISIGNLECVVAEKGKPVEKRFNFLAHPTCLPVLKRHFTAFSVANNHSGDFGKAAFVEQCDLLERADIPYFGGGRNKAAAHQPWIVERHGVRIALLAYCEVFSSSFQAEDNVAGVAWSAHDDEVLADLRAAREKHKADVVIPFMHWGPENEPASERQKSLARKMIDAGADVVVGAHPHVRQEIEYYKQHLIAYSLGNFVFNGFTHEDNLTGWALRLAVNKQGMVAWDTVTVRIDERGVPHPDLKTKSPSGHTGSDEIANTLPSQTPF